MASSAATHRSSYTMEAGNAWVAVGRWEREDDSSAPSGAEVKNERSYTSTATCAFVTWAGARRRYWCWFLQTSQLKLCREIIAVCSQIHTKHINTLCGQNVELLNVKLAVHIMTTGL